MRYPPVMPAYRCSVCAEIYDIPSEAVACCRALKENDPLAELESYEPVWRCPNCNGVYETKADAETCC